MFLLTGDILNINQIIDSLRKSGKLVYVHIDLIGGVAKDIFALKYIHSNIRPDGIITTRSNIIREAKGLGLFSIQGLFLLDSLSLASGIISIKSTTQDAVEILPGIIPKMIKSINKEVNIPIIAGGLIKDKTDVINSLKGGAIGISTSNENVWYM